jgi:prepilin-type N-terminal cleavage/methylation domain-containing protein
MSEINLGINSRRGFTLIELLVVIAILAVLAVAVVLVLNPAELLKEGRDTTRLSDLSTLNSAIALWTADVINTSGVGGWPTSGGYYCTATSTKPGGGAGCSAASTTLTNGNGWIPIDFGRIASGAPLSRLPVDPNNGNTGCKGVTTTICQYAFAASTSTAGVYELDAQMESAKFYSATSTEVVTNDKDGGNDNAIYETGSRLTLF